MKHVVLVGTLIVALAVPAVVVSGQTAPAGNTSLGSVTVNRRVMLDGKPLAPGTYQVRLSAEMPKPGTGQSPDGERYVEFVRGGKVAGREVATVVSAADIGQTLRAAVDDHRRVDRKSSSSRATTICASDQPRRMNYLIHLPTKRPDKAGTVKPPSRRTARDGAAGLV